MQNKRQTTTEQHWAEVVVGTLLVLLLLGLYLLQARGILHMGPSEVQRTPAPTPAAVVDPIQLHFTMPGYSGDTTAHHGGLDEILAADIARAHTSVDVAAYEFELNTVAEALVAAHRQGVQVRLVTDTDNVDESAVRRLKRARIPVVDDGRGAIMHNKFVVIDGQVVWTGSWNLTENGTYRNDNNVVRITSEALAENYTAEFEEMFLDGAFGPTSPADTPYPQLTVPRPDTGRTVQLENYFAPEDQVMDRLLALVEAAGTSIRFLAYSFTDDALGQLLEGKSKEGLVVQGVFEERGSDTEYSEYGRLRQAQPPLDVVTDGNPYVMHHKVFILDDEIVVLGSFNFSESADESNDENLLVIHDPGVAARYQAEFQRIYDQAVSEGQ